MTASLDVVCTRFVRFEKRRYPMARNVAVTLIMAGFVLAYTNVSSDAQSGMGSMKQDASKAPRLAPVTG